MRGSGRPRAGRLALCLASASVWSSTAGGQELQEASKAWQWSITPYVWAAGTKGRVGARDVVGSVDVTTGDVLQTGKVALMPPTAPVNQVARMDGPTLFSRFAALTTENPPHPNDYPQLQRMHRLGIVPGVPVTRERLSSNAWTALDRAIPFAQRKIRDHATRAARIMNGWVMMASPIGTYGTDYLKRALVAFMGLGASPVEDAIFPTAFTMADGSPFDSDAKYEVRLPHNGQPPARAFWSLTMYNDQQLFADNPIQRYAIGNRDHLRYDSDGSLMSVRSWASQVRSTASSVDSGTLGGGVAAVDRDSAGGAAPVTTNL